MAKVWQWTADRVAHACLHQFMDRSAVIIPNCYFTGYEADLLVVDSRSLKLIDIEIKVDRSDLKADISKDKWNISRWVSENGVSTRKEFRREFAPKVWKHYFAMPAALWKPELEDFIPKTSGVITFSDYKYSGSGTQVKVVRRAKTNPEAKAISDRDVFNLGRLANLRYWERKMSEGKDRQIGKVEISGVFIHPLRMGLPPDPGYLAAMQKLLVVDVQHDAMEDKYLYTCWSQEFRKIPMGEVIPVYDIVIESGNPVFRERKNDE